MTCTCQNIEQIQKYFGDIRFYVENIAYLFQFEGTMTEADFLNRVLKNTGCGWLRNSAVPSLKPEPVLPWRII